MSTFYILHEMIRIFGISCMPMNNHFIEGKTPLMHACMHGMTTIAMQMIQTFGDNCNPEYIYKSNDHHNTALICACNSGMPLVAREMIKKFGYTVVSGYSRSTNQMRIRHARKFSKM